MKVGLVRHFRVQQPFPKQFLVSPDEVAAWFEAYDAAPIEEGAVDLGGVDWKRCFASDLPRAVATAQKIYGGEITQTEGLREIPAYLHQGKRLRLPFMLWAIVVRVGWLLDTKSQPESQAAVKQRVEAALDQILQSKEDVLIVSHAALMTYLQKALIKRSFTGPAFRTAENGKLYIFEG